MRLDKFLSHTGFGTRSEVKKIIKKGNVTIDGVVCKSDSVHVDENNSVVEVDGQRVEYIKNIYIILNKPKGVISATEDRRHETVIGLMPEYAHLDIFPVGRLDIDTTGLLLITNDGELAHELLSPNNHIPKTYKVTLRDKFDDSYINKVEKGIDLNDFVTMPGKLEKISDFVCNITIFEGKFHQVKRMFEAMGNEVVELERISFANLRLENDLKYGEYKLISKDDI